MKVYLAKHSGFCLGVKRALNIVKQTTACHKNVYIKGDLIHNEMVCDNLKAQGIKRVSSLKSIPQNSLLIIKAHGEPQKTYHQAKLKNLKIVDATCPKVLDIRKKAKEIENQGYQIIIIGDKNHQETIGILGNMKQGLVLENRKDVSRLKSKIKKKIGVVCQSTQSIENVSQIVARLAEYAEEFLFLNTICSSTHLRQEEVKKLASKCEAVLVVGSRKSANTKRLFFLAKKINKSAFWVSAPRKLNKAKFSKIKSLGIIGGASTPKEVLQKIYNDLQIHRP